MRNLVQLMTFLEVVNRHSFASAARHLKITPAAVSKHIASLEKHLGVLLLKRSTHQLDLTHEGLIFFEHAKKIAETVEQAEAAISQTKEEPTGILRVVCGIEFANLYVFPHLEECQARYPKLQLHFELTQTIPDIEKEKIDLLMGFSKSIPPNCIQRCLIYTRNVLCASPEYLKAYGVPRKPADLINHQLIAHNRQSNNVLTFKNEDKIYFEAPICLNDTRAMKTCALANLGIVQLHDYIIEKELKTKELVEILGSYMDQNKNIPLYVAYPQTNHVHINVRRFTDFILEKIKIRSSS